jgi:hypothetical protein
VITFDTPVVGISPVVLPTRRLLDQLERRKGFEDQLFTVVGYGATQGPPCVRDLNRRFAVSGFKSLGRALLRLSMNQAKGYGGASAGDSGGAIFLGTSNNDGRNCRFAGDGSDVRGLPSRYAIGARVPLRLRDAAELGGLTLPAAIPRMSQREVAAS